MSNTTASPNMNLQVPVVGTETSPQWATDINSCFQAVDAHDHSPGYGVQVTPAGLNINADLTLQSNNLTNARTLRLVTQNSTPAGASDLGCLYESSTGDLYFIDGAGNNVRLTQSGSIVGTAGSITGLPSGTASVAYNSVAGSYVFQKATSTPALLDVGSILIRNNSASSKALTLNAPAAMGADITQTLPTIPAAQNIMTMDSTGAMAAAWNVDSATIVVSGNLLAVPNFGIGTNELANSAVTTAKIADAAVTAAKIADAAVTAAKIANATITTTQISGSAGITGGQLAAGAIGTTQLANSGVTRPKLAALGQQVSSSSGSFSSTSTSFTAVTNLSVSITTTGRPVFVSLIGDGSANAAVIGVSAASATFASGVIGILNGATIVGKYSLTQSGATASLINILIPPGSVFQIDTPAAGTYTYTVQVLAASGNTFVVSNVKLIAYEL